MTKQCFICKEIKLLDLFNRNRKTKDGKSSWCTSCAKIKNREWYIANKVHKLKTTKAWAQNNPDKVKKSIQKYTKKNGPKLALDRRLKRYGITLDKYNEMVDSQNGTCVICNCVPNKLVIDHSHVTNKVRELLCISCNAALGQVKENENTMMSMLSYIRKHNGRKV